MLIFLQYKNKISDFGSKKFNMKKEKLYFRFNFKSKKQNPKIKQTKKSNELKTLPMDKIIPNLKKSPNTLLWKTKSSNFERKHLFFVNTNSLPVIYFKYDINHKIKNCTIIYCVWKIDDEANIFPICLQIVFVPLRYPKQITISSGRCNKYDKKKQI